MTQLHESPLKAESQIDTSGKPNSDNFMADDDNYQVQPPKNTPAPKEASDYGFIEHDEVDPPLFDNSFWSANYDFITFII